jgi:hypothetical protein
MQEKDEMASVHVDSGEVLLERLKKRMRTTHDSFYLLVLELATHVQVGLDISGMGFPSFSSHSNINILFRFISPFILLIPPIYT